MYTRMKMIFLAKDWRRTYDFVQQLGTTLKDSRPTYDEDGNYFAPKLELSKEAQLVLEDKIRKLILKNNRYLDQCGMKPNKPLWHYDRKNPETHMSAPEFKYWHLVKDVA